ncbi:cytochrome P450 4C1-like isoform X2 [Solenopsis invicta]|uniref:cytochrome P450 4C1-like isoform X2 n=1 Tax=Solenopsis invicta TaxID=13686 RepID=UPI00193D6DB9|nr:cytochrome P450 4C1-like isoform X2 [Solenopsis invicta]
MQSYVSFKAMRPWFKNSWVFSLSPRGKEQAKLLKILHGFTEKIIAERKDYHKRTNGQYMSNFSKDAVADETETIGIKKRRLAMLNLLIQAAQEGLLTDVDIREEVNTFMFEDCVRKEINAVMRENQGKLTMKSLQDLQYLERCIKETLRLYPSVFFISRITSEEIQLQTYLIPAGTIVTLHFYMTHRDLNFWPNPEIFDPDRFLPENIRNRHPYSYLPFSVGPRNCIGQRFALLELKAMIAPLIHNFYLEPVDYLKNLRIGIDLILRPLNPHRLKFIPIATKYI